MKSSETKRALAQSLLTVNETTELSRISVSQIVEHCGCNRKTFYYQFPDKDALIHWVFRFQLGHYLETQCAGDTLLYTDTDTLCAAFPYYLEKRTGVRSLDGSPFFRALADTFAAQRSFYNQALAMTATGCLTDYLYRLYTPTLENDIRFILSNRYLKAENLHFLAEYYTGSFITYFTRQLKSRTSGDLLEDIGPFTNLIHSSLEDVIKNQQARRVL